MHKGPQPNLFDHWANAILQLLLLKSFKLEYTHVFYWIKYHSMTYFGLICKLDEVSWYDLWSITYDVWSITYEVSRMKYHVWSITYEVSHMKYHIWIITYEVSRMKYEVSRMTYEVSHMTNEVSRYHGIGWSITVWLTYFGLIWIKANK